VLPCVKIAVLEVVLVVLLLLDKESEINFLMKIALEKVAFLPYGYLIDKWRWEIANRSISPESYNKKYWKLR